MFFLYLYITGYFPELMVDVSLSELKLLSSTSALQTSDGRRMPTESDGFSFLGAIEQGKMLKNSLLDIRPHYMTLTTLKKAEDRDSLILRFYNPVATTEDVELYVSPLIKFSKAYLCGLNEIRKDGGELQVKQNEDSSKLITIRVTAKKIITVELA